jgi:hypothetical protein
MCFVYVMLNGNCKCHVLFREIYFFLYTGYLQGFFGDTFRSLHQLQQNFRILSDLDVFLTQAVMKLLKVKILYAEWSIMFQLEKIL